MGRPVSVYLGDIVHDYVGKGPFMFPINIGYVAAWARHQFDRAVDVRLFKFPGELIEAVRSAPPDILGLGNYAWNVDLNNKLAAFAKRLSPGMVTVYGGPNLPTDDTQCAAFVERRPMVDLHVEHQGEPGFANILRRYLGGACAPAALTRDPIDGCVSWDRNERRLVRGRPTERIKDLDVIPSPYLTGLLDRFFDENLIPLVETNRGCPYGCTFCAWGNAYLQKVNVFGFERVADELRYIAQRVHRSNILMIADANFGIMDRRDLEIARVVRQLQESTGFPRTFSAQWAKNKSKKIVDIAEILGESTSVTASFQSLDEEALRNVKRGNIKLSAYRDIVEYMNRKGVPSFSEMILGLPGETRASFLDGLRQLFDLNCGSVISYNLRMLDGTELATPADRERFGFRTKYRLLDTMFGHYADFTAIECEEIVLTTNTMSEDDILFFRPLQWLIQLSWNYKYYYELLKYLQHAGINPADFLQLVLERAPDAPEPVRRLFADFAGDARSEWFSSEEALVRHYGDPPVFDGIARGEFGKLNFKYMFRVLLECREDFDRHMEACALAALAQRGRAEAAPVVRDLIRFLRQLCLDFRGDLPSTLERIVSNDWDIMGQYASAGVEARADDTETRFDYDVLAWREQLYARPLESYRVEGGVRYVFFVPPDQQKGLAVRFRQYQTKNLNLTLRKMTEYMRLSDLFYRVRRADVTAAAPSHIPA